MVADQRPSCSEDAVVDHYATLPSAFSSHENATFFASLTSYVLSFSILSFWHVVGACSVSIALRLLWFVPVALDIRRWSAAGQLAATTEDTQATSTVPTLDGNLTLTSNVSLARAEEAAAPSDCNGHSAVDVRDTRRSEETSPETTRVDVGQSDVFIMDDARTGALEAVDYDEDGGSLNNSHFSIGLGGGGNRRSYSSDEFTFRKPLAAMSFGKSERLFLHFRSDAKLLPLLHRARHRIQSLLAQKRVVLGQLSLR